MTLALYTRPDPDYRLSQAGNDFHNPLSVSLDGVVGGAVVRKLYLRNDNNDRYYTNITLQAVDTSYPQYTNQTDWNWKLAEADLSPPEEAWAEIDPGNILILSTSMGSSSQGETGVYYTIWLRVQAPSKQLAKNVSSIVIRLNAEERLVGV